MVRLAFLVLGVIAMAASGCCGPAGCGIGCSTGCGDCGSPSVSGCGCGGGACGGGVRSGGPFSALRNARKQMICGSGCGEAYIGEWISTPPDCQDPCCNDQFIGGAVKARPFCRQRSRGGLLRGLYGGRNCSGNASSADCGCGEVSCDVCSEGDYTVSGYDTGGYTEVISSGVQEGGCGCSTCRASSPMASRLASARGRVAGRSITSSAKYNQITERAQQIRR